MIFLKTLWYITMFFVFFISVISFLIPSFHKNLKLKLIVYYVKLNISKINFNNRIEKNKILQSEKITVKIRRVLIYSIIN